MPGQLHTLVVIDELGAYDGELRRVVELRVGDGREPGSELVAKDAPQQPRIHFPGRGVIDLLPSHPGRIGEHLEAHFLGRAPLLLGRHFRLIGGVRFAWGAGGAVHDVLDRGRAGEEGTHKLSDAGQARCVATDPCPLLLDR